MRYYGLYKGLKFRSLLEYSYMKHLEDEGVDLHSEIEYESFRIPYRIGKGKLRTYIPDFFIKKLLLVVELKYEKHLLNKKNRSKIDAAKQYFIGSGYQYRVVTEKEIKLFKMKDAALDENIVWTEKMKKRLDRKMKR